MSFGQFPNDPGLGVSSPINLVTAGAGVLLASKLLAGDANPAFQILGDGTLKWGLGGVNPPDVILRHDPTALRLTTPFGFYVESATTGESLIALSLTTVNIGAGYPAHSVLVSSSLAGAELDLAAEYDVASTVEIRLLKDKIGFYNTAPVAKPVVTGSKGANAALTSLMAALAGQGLVTDSTT